MADPTPPLALDEARLTADLLKARVKAKLLGGPTPTVVLGGFELLRSLGRGATGAVFEARDVHSGAEVAVKVLRDSRASSVARFKAEFRGLARVVHENLVQLHQLFVERETWCFSMELVRGVPFTRYARAGQGQGESCHPERLRAALVQLLSAVQAVHEAGWLHCDLKPSNVLVTETGRVVVLDFGLLTAAADRRVPRAEMIFGTPAYMAPELDAGHVPSAASDAYAVGVMLFQALTGALPFTNAGAALTRSRTQNPAPRARDIEPGAAPDLDALCAGLLEREPSARMTIAEARAALAPPTAFERASVVRGARAGLVGREGELSTLRSAFERAKGGQTAPVLVRGRSGIGKTALLETFAAELDRPDTLVLAGRCHERESVPYKAFDAVIDALAAALGKLSAQERQALAPAGTAALLRIFPQLTQSLSPPERDDDGLPRAPHEQRQAAFAAFKELLRRLSAGRRIALIVDDLQWADLDSARLLLELLGPPSAPALLYLGCYREEEEPHSEFVRELRARADADGSAQTFAWMTLGPLSEHAAVELATALVPAHTAGGSDVAERAARESAGLPFMLVELVAHALEPAQHGRAATSLSELLASKLTVLAASERHALSLLSLAARPVAGELLASALREPAAARALRRLVIAGLVQHDAHGRFVVYHDRLREHVSEHVSSADAATLHGDLARAYEQAPSAEPEWLIEHWRAAGEPARACESAVRAADAASGKLAFNRAASLYRTALSLLPQGDPRAASMQESLGEALINAGRSAEAAMAFLAAAGGSRSNAALALRCRAAQQQLRCGRKDDAVALVHELFEKVGLPYPRSTVALYGGLVRTRARIAVRTRFRRPPRASVTSSTHDRLQVLRSVFREFAVYDPLRSALFQGWFYELALRAGDRDSIFVGLAWDAYQRAFLAGARRSERLRADLQALDTLAEELATPYARATAAMMRGVAAMFAGDYRQAADCTGRALRMFRERCLGATWEEAICAIAYYAMIENTGPLTIVCEDAPRMVRLADERIDQFTDGLLGAHMASTLLAQDRPVDAEAFLRQRLSRLGGGMDARHLGLLWRLVDTQLYMADGCSAFQTIEGMWPAYLASGYDRSAFFRLFAHKRRAHAAIMAHRERRDPRLLELARREAAEIARSRRMDGQVISLGIRAALALERGDRASASARLSTARGHCRQLGLPVVESCHLLALGRVTEGAQGRAWVEQAEAALRAQGVEDPARWSYFYAGCFNR